jgi:beta-lactamase superfamily II metal-dependent hydrolase
MFLLLRRRLSGVVVPVVIGVLAYHGVALADMSVHFIDVGQGGGVFVQKDGKTLLYDCGDTFAGQTVTDYLDALDVGTLDLLIISHAHKDHMGGCTHVLQNVNVKRILHNGSRARTGTWKKFLKVAAQKGTAMTVAKDMTEDGMEILVAYDSHGPYSKEADNSVLVRLVDGKVRVLLTGDCEAVCEKEVGNTSDVRSEVLNVGHHGSNAASSLEFLRKVKPKIGVIQAGAGNQYGHPKPSVLTRLKQVGTTIYRTDKDGSIVIHSDGTTVTVETEQ